MSFCDVCVVIPNFNRTAQLRYALLSVSGQTLPPREVIVVDDHSEDNHFDAVLEIVSEFRNRLNINLVRNETNRGANFSRNRGIALSNSRFTAFLDSDDIWLPNKLELQMARIAESSTGDGRPVLSATGRYRANANGDIIVQQYGGAAFSSRKIRASNFIGTLSSVIVETWIARHIHGFNENLPACQDWDFFIRLADYVRYVGVPDPLCVYMDHGESRITLNNRQRLRAHIFIYREHIRPVLADRQRAEFYRNVAEDLQALGRVRWCARFRARSISKKYITTRWLAWAVEAVFLMYFRVRTGDSIKQRRYDKYTRMRARDMNDPGRRASMYRDQAWLKALVRTETS